ncbi:ATP-binding protein [Sneathiella limimaris]|uniref:ATP-binding protein n=1 Tax=Sneathiella limimaris TaxID=1964213 RepID=UPI00146A44DA|nr:ATP-binding protein [Sneathiella limimaris]
MLKPELPDYEDSRLRAMQKLRLWKTFPEEGFDRICRLVAKLMKVPVVQINLVGETTVWSKSNIGVQKTERPREDSICAYTILQNDLICISDVEQDDRFKQNSYDILGKPLKYYVGLPLKAYGGFNVGTLCLMDNKARTLQYDEFEALKDFAEAIQQQFNLSRLEQDGRFLVSQTSRLNTLLEALADGIMTIDSDGLVESVNQSAASIFGYERSELLGQNFSLLLPDLGKGGWEGYLQFLRKSDIPFQPNEKHDIFGQRKDGSLFPMDLVIREMQVEGSLLYTGIIRDITEQKKFEDEILKSRQVLEATKENMPAALAVFDDKFKLSVSNSKLAEVLDLPPEEIQIGTSFKSFVNAMFDRGYFGEWSGKRRETEFRKVLTTYKSPLFLHLKKKGRYVEIITRYMPDGGFISTYIDITERLKNEEKLEKLVKRANDANEAKTNFLSTISHEIRTPLNGVIGVAHMLEDTDLDDRQQELLQTILHSGNTLLSLINDVLDMNKIESGNLEIEKILCDIVEVLDSVRAPFEYQAGQKGLKFNVEIGDDVLSHVLSDPTRIRQILMNLVGNALKFTDKGSITISVQRQEDMKDGRQMLAISVIDTGAGIPENRLNAIFDSFSQADNTINRRFGGTGLGLTIVRKLVELMGGNISVTSKMGKGSTFTVTLPVGIATNQEILQTVSDIVAADSGTLDKLHVLIAEDNAVNAMITKTFLENLGHTSEVAENGKIAVDRVGETHFDMILMDVHMPIMDGIEATSLIRKRFDSEDLPIIGVTAEAFTDRHAYMKKMGMNDVLTKPFTKPQLQKLVTKYHVQLEKHRMKNGVQKKIDRGILEGTQKIQIGNSAQLQLYRDQMGAETFVSLLRKSPYSVKTELEEMQKGLEGEDRALINRSARTIASIALSLHSDRLAEQASLIEQNANEIPEVNKVLPILIDTADETFAWWDAMVDEDAPQSLEN